MSLPITYSNEVLWNMVDGPGSSYSDITKARQSRPYDLPSEYLKKQGYTVAASYSGVIHGFSHNADVGVNKGIWGWGPDVNSTFGTQIALSNNNGYEKFADKVKGVSTMVAVDIAEFNQSLDMIEKRAKQLLLFCNALRQRRFSQAAALLGVKMPKSVKHLGKTIADTFLEFHFGWEPLIGDIGAAVDILQGDVPDKHVNCRGKRVERWLRSSANTGSFLHTTEVKATVQTSCSCRVKISNPSLHMADQLGFINPAGIAWELVPFSFVVDWFVPVSSFLNSMTDFLGLDLDRASYFTLLRTPAWLYSEVSTDPNFPGSMIVAFTGVYAKRTLGIPSVTLVPGRMTGISPVRAATALSLLLQQGLGRL